ncbi:hypothetical protein D3C75_278270 [compost metagenome]
MSAVLGIFDLLHGIIEAPGSSAADIALVRRLIDQAPAAEGFDRFIQRGGRRPVPYRVSAPAAVHKISKRIIRGRNDQSAGGNRAAGRCSAHGYRFVRYCERVFPDLPADSRTASSDINALRQIGTRRILRPHISGCVDVICSCSRCCRLAGSRKHSEHEHGRHQDGK